jgi:hypothetical protein
MPTEQLPLVGEVNANFFLNRECLIVSMMDPYSRILGFLDRSFYFFFFFLQVTPHLYSTRLSGPRSRPTISQNIWWRR